jgi:hypothetical protein
MHGPAGNVRALYPELAKPRLAQPLHDATSSQIVATSHPATGTAPSRRSKGPTSSLDTASATRQPEGEAATGESKSSPVPVQAAERRCSGPETSRA